jgi:hypothetical protein
MLDTLRQAVAETLERKRRLGQYAVVWRNGRPEFIGEAPPLPRAADGRGPKSSVGTQSDA